jgi:YD repeat-containing protein
VAAISPSGAVTRYRFDPARQLTEVIDANGGATRYAYDDAGNLTVLTDAKGAVTRYGYDADGRQISVTDPLNRTTRRAFDAAGDLITITDQSGHSQQLSYDAEGRLVRRVADDGTEAGYAYDSCGRRTSMTDATGTTRYTYDLAGRLTAVTEPDRGVTTASYDAAGQQTSLRYPDGLEIGYEYDLNGGLTALHDSRSGSAVYAVDPDGRLVTEQLPGRLERRYHYEHGLPRRFLVVRDGHPALRTSFTHDPDGRIASQRDDEKLIRYRYDPQGQLASVVGDGQELHLTYDAVGNRTSMRAADAVAGGPGQLNTETRYLYDAADQLLETDVHGRRTEFRYDTSGRLTEETCGERHHRIVYDGFGRPVEMIWRTRGATERVQAVYNGDDLLASLTLTASGEHGGSERSATVRYLWGSPDVADAIPQILSQRVEPRVEDAEGDRPGRLDADFAYGYGRTFASWEHGAASFHHDASGSPIRTRKTDAWVQASHYGPFGEPADVPRDDGDPDPGGHPLAAPELPRFGYRGELALGALVYLRARWYDTALGRFTTGDPIPSPDDPRSVRNNFGREDPRSVRNNFGREDPRSVRNNFGREDPRSVRNNFGREVPRSVRNNFGPEDPRSVRNHAMKYVYAAKYPSDITDPPRGLVPGGAPQTAEQEFTRWVEAIDGGLQSHLLWPVLNLPVH